MMSNFLSLFRKNWNTSYSQSGEDRIVSFLFDWLQIQSPSYLDIGAHHSSWLNNTYLFYKAGSTGVCVEPDPSLFSELKRNRSRDICLNIGIGSGAKEMAEFYVMSSRSLNTFSKKDALMCEMSRNFGEQKIEEIIQVPLRTVDEIMSEHLPSGVNFISIDVEGLDYEIVKSFDFKKYQPEVFCIETLRYDDQGVLKKNYELIEFMLDQGYSTYGDTYINTIFVSKDAKSLLK